jgi:EpsI family protein
MPVLLAVALFAPTAYLAANVANQSEKSLSKGLANVGAQLAGYHADDSKGAGFYKDPIADVDLSRIYSANQSPPIELYVAFKGKQPADKRLKSPRLGFPYGWNYVWIEPAQVPSASVGQTITANWMLTQSGQNQVLVLYWFQTGEQTLGGEFEKRMLQIRNVLWHGRSDAAVVRLATPVSSSDKINEAKDRLTRFAAELYPRLRDVLPI